MNRLFEIVWGNLKKNKAVWTALAGFIATVGVMVSMWDNIRDWSKPTVLYKAKTEQRGFIRSFINNKSAQKHICNLADRLTSDRITLYLGDSLEFGLGIMEFQRIRLDSGLTTARDSSYFTINFSRYEKVKRMNAVITHECKDEHIYSEKQRYGEIVAGFLIPVIKDLETHGGVSIMYDDSTITNPSLKQVFDQVNVKSVADMGIYRQAELHRKPYLIGALVVTYINDRHRFTKIELSNIKISAEIISVLIENAYLKWLNKKK